MMSKCEFFLLVLDACPSFLTTWELLQHDRNGASDDALHDRAVDAFCRHVARMVRHSQTENCVPTIAAIERLFVEGEPDVQKTVRSLIQALQLQSRGSTSADSIRRLLGTRSAQHWDDFEKWLQANRSIDEWAKLRTGTFPKVDLDAINDPELRRSLQRSSDLVKNWFRREMQ
jgi:hypothetical protein